MSESALDAFLPPREKGKSLLDEEGEDSGPYLLAESVEDVRTYLRDVQAEGPVVALDTETNGLDTRIAKLVGMSICVSTGTGIYIPVGHKLGTNVPARPVIELVTGYLKETNLNPVFYNAKFDVSILLQNTGWKPKVYEDAMNLVMLEDPDRREKDLKSVAKADCGFEMKEFESLFTPEERKAKVFDLSTKHPRRVKNYAAADADGTLRVYRQKMGIKEEFTFPYTVDTLLVEVIRKLEQSGGLEINIEYVNEKIRDLRNLAEVLKSMVMEQVGYQFEIESPKQLGDALFGALGLESPGLTKTGQHKTSEKDLERLAEVIPIVRWVLTYRKVIKAISSYFEKLERLHTHKIPVRFSFNQFSAPTYRLAAPGGSPEKDGKTGINIQAVSNGEVMDFPGVLLQQEPKKGVKDYLVEMPNEELLFAQSEAVVKTFTEGPVSWEPMLDLPHILRQEETEIPVCVRAKCEGCPRRCEERGLDVSRRTVKNVRVIPSVRQAFRAPEGYQLVGFDYDRQEIVIGANLSKESAWISALKNGVDLHSQTAAAAYNLSLEDFERLPKDDKKRKRDIGKVLNFATFYGATARTLSRNTGVALATAEMIYDGFKRRHPQLFSWMDKMHAFARRKGYVTTFFGRRRWLKKYYESGDRGEEGFGDRSSVNTPIQGTGADVIRIAMVKTDKWLGEMGYTEDQVRLVMSIHDELLFMIREDLVLVIGPGLRKQMMFHVKGWEIQLSVGPKVGKIWGRQKEQSFAEAA